jgi:hypothetical protein
MPVFQILLVNKCGDKMIESVPNEEKLKDFLINNISMHSMHSTHSAHSTSKMRVTELIAEAIEVGKDASCGSDAKQMQYNVIAVIHGAPFWIKDTSTSSLMASA